MKNPEITILMTVYNAEQYLKQSISSIIGQTYQDFEFLIIDDRSTDNSIQIVKSFKDDRIRLHCNDINLGQTKSLNVGLHLARGKYIARMDADDFAYSRWLEKLIVVLEKNQDCVVVSANTVVVDENNRVKRFFRLPGEYKDIVLRSMTFSPINHVGSIMRKNVIIGLGGYDEQYSIAADYNLWVELIMRGKTLVSCDDNLVAIREHSKSLSRSGRYHEGINELCRVMRKMCRFITGNAQIDGQVKLVCDLFFNEDRLDQGEFEMAMDALENLYQSILPAFNMETDRVNRFLKNRAKTAVLKRINKFIEKKDSHIVKMTAKYGMDKFGAGSYFTMISLMSYLGPNALTLIPKFYLSILSIKSRMAINYFKK